MDRQLLSHSGAGLVLTAFLLVCSMFVWSGRPVPTAVHLLTRAADLCLDTRAPPGWLTRLGLAPAFEPARVSLVCLIPMMVLNLVFTLAGTLAYSTLSGSSTAWSEWWSSTQADLASVVSDCFIAQGIYLAWLALSCLHLPGLILGALVRFRWFPQLWLCSAFASFAGRDLLRPEPGLPLRCLLTAAGLIPDLRYEIASSVCGFICIFLTSSTLSFRRGFMHSWGHMVFCAPANNVLFRLNGRNASVSQRDRDAAGFVWSMVLGHLVHFVYDHLRTARRAPAAEGPVVPEPAVPTYKEITTYAALLFLQDLGRNLKLGRQQLPELDVPESARMIAARIRAEDPEACRAAVEALGCLDAQEAQHLPAYVGLVYLARKLRRGPPLLELGTILNQRLESLGLEARVPHNLTQRMDRFDECAVAGPSCVRTGTGRGSPQLLVGPLSALPDELGTVPEAQDLTRWACAVGAAFMGDRNMGYPYVLWQLRCQEAGTALALFRRGCGAAGLVQELVSGFKEFIKTFDSENEPRCLETATALNLVMTRGGRRSVDSCVAGGMLLPEPLRQEAHRLCGRFRAHMGRKLMLESGRHASADRGAAPRATQQAVSLLRQLRDQRHGFQQRERALRHELAQRMSELQRLRVELATHVAPHPRQAGIESAAQALPFYGPGASAAPRLGNFELDLGDPDSPAYLRARPAATQGVADAASGPAPGAVGACPSATDTLRGSPSHPLPRSLRDGA